MSNCTKVLFASLCCVILFSGVFASHAWAESTDDVVLYDFRSDQCRPCRAMDPIVHKLKDEGYAIRIINVNEEPELAERYNVSSLPCFIVAVDGKEVSRIEGATSRSKLQDLMRLGTAAASQRSTPITKSASRESNGGQFIYTPDRLTQRFPNSDSYNSDLNSIQMVAEGAATVRPSIGGNSNGQLVELEGSGRRGFVPNPSNQAGELSLNSGRQHNRKGDIPGSSSSLQFADPANGQSWPQRGELMEASVRLILSDANSRSFGSGTIIDCRQGEALIVTCGHIFRDWSERSRITVDMFGPNAEQQVPGRVLMHDLKSDVAIVAIQVKRPIRAAHVAKEGTKIQKGEPALAIGCEHGEDVATFPTKITNIDKYLGPPNLQIAGQPQQGRSGGGLFNRNGDLIGICNAADKVDNEGLYAGLNAVHQMLDKAQLAFVYRTGSTPPKFERELARITSQDPPQMPTRMPLVNRDDQFASNAAVRTDLEVARNPNEQFADSLMPSTSSTMNAPREFAPNGNLIAAASVSTNNATPNQLNPNASENIDNSNLLLNQAITQNRSNQEAEVICIVRPRDSRQPHGTVVVLERASAEFLAKLEAEKAAQQQRTGNASTQQPVAPSPYPPSPSQNMNRDAAAVAPVSVTSPTSANLLPTTESRHIPTGAPIAWPMR